jgi:integrase
VSAAAVEHLTEGGERVEIRLMLTISRAIDLYLGDKSRQGRTDRTREKYGPYLDKFCAMFPADSEVQKITTNDCRRWLDRYQRHAANTQAQVFSILHGFVSWLYHEGQLKRDPMENLMPPRKPSQEDLDVTTISTDDAKKLLRQASTMGWTVWLAVAIAVYLGPRRSAINALRRSDYDQQRQRIRFKEKGAKTIWKPVPDELAGILDRAIAEGVYEHDDDYLVPSFSKQRRAGTRDARIIYGAIDKAAYQANVKTHVHALRAAFATYYLEQNDKDLIGCKELLGHKRVETTMVYLRRLDKEQAMEPVRSLSWA